MGDGSLMTRADRRCQVASCIARIPGRALYRESEGTPVLALSRRGDALDGSVYVRRRAISCAAPRPGHPKAGA